MPATATCLRQATCPAPADPGTVTGSVHSWDLSTGVDGPGTRFVVFTAGCPLRCAYCHNPDTWFGRTGRRMSADAVLTLAGRYRRFIGAAGGGLTVSGGEPLLQPAFTRAVLARSSRRSATSNGSTCSRSTRSAQPSTPRSAWTTPVPR